MPRSLPQLAPWRQPHFGLLFLAILERSRPRLHKNEPYHHNVSFRGAEAPRNLLRCRSA